MAYPEFPTYQQLKAAIAALREPTAKVRPDNSTIQVVKVGQIDLAILGILDALTDAVEEIHQHIEQEHSK